MVQVSTTNCQIVTLSICQRLSVDLFDLFLFVVCMLFPSRLIKSWAIIGQVSTDHAPILASMGRRILTPAFVLLHSPQ